MQTLKIILLVTGLKHISYFSFNWCFNYDYRIDVSTIIICNECIAFCNMYVMMVPDCLRVCYVANILPANYLDMPGNPDWF